MNLIVDVGVASIGTYRFEGVPVGAGIGAAPGCAC